MCEGSLTLILSRLCFKNTEVVRGWCLMVHIYYIFCAVRGVCVAAAQMIGSDPLIYTSEKGKKKNPHQSRNRLFLRRATMCISSELSGSGGVLDYHRCAQCGSKKQYAVLETSKKCFNGCSSDPCGSSPVQKDKKKIIIPVAGLRASRSSAQC